MIFQRYICFVFVSAWILTPLAQARTWTSANGTKHFEADLVSYDESTQTVTVLLNGSPKSFSQAFLSKADIEFLKKQHATSSEAAAPAEAPEATAPPEAAAPVAPLEVPEKIELLLENYCWDCHDEATQKGDLRLDQLGGLKLDARLDLLNKMQERVHFEEMPPQKKKSQPTNVERKELLAWISGELGRHDASKLEDKLRTPAYGNYVNHEKLFSGEYKDLKAFTPDRRWLISEFIFEAKFNKLLDHRSMITVDGKRRPVIGSNNRLVNLTNPFLLPTDSGVRYYDTTTLDGGHLLTMITNAKNVADSLIQLAERNDAVPAIRPLIGQEWEHHRILSTRESYLKASIENLLAEIYGPANAALLPKFTPSKAEAPKNNAGADGQPIKKPNFDTASPGREDMVEVWAGMHRYLKPGASDDVIITKCERDWFLAGVNERTLKTRITFMRNYMDELHKRLPKLQLNAPSPLATEEMKIIRETIQAQRKKGDHYSEIIEKCMTAWKDTFQQQRAKAGPPSDELTHDLIHQLFVKILERSPTTQEMDAYTALTQTDFEKIGTQEAIRKLIQTLILNSEFVYRIEFGEGAADPDGRKMLSPYHASYAIAYALTDSSPDEPLAKAAASGQLNTREDYKREVERMLAKRDQYYLIDETVEKGGSDSFTTMPIRELRFFRDFFGYPRMLPIFKDNKRFGGDYVNTTARLVSEADMLVAHILEDDKNVFEKLLTTEEFYVYHSGDNEAMTTATENIRKIYDYFKDKNWQKFSEQEFLKHLPFFKQVPVRNIHPDEITANKKAAEAGIKSLQRSMESYVERLGNGQKSAMPFPAYSSHGKTEASTRSGNQMRGEGVAKTFNLDLVNWNYPATQPAKMEHRKGILTHPAWLIAFAANTETDPVRRGKWVREKLLAGTVPDVPVTVDAVIPEDHHKTLRSRLASVTEATYCWTCHEKMNPLGNTFEMYDDFGRFRTEESLENPDNLITKMPDKGPPQADLRDIYQTLPVNATGRLEGTGDPTLDGDVKDAIDLATRLGKSAKVRQSMIRHAFRYFMGRNEFLSDSKTLIDADQAYVQSGGSFDAVIVSLLTSDSFIYRKSTSH